MTKKVNVVDKFASNIGREAEEHEAIFLNDFVGLMSFDADMPKEIRDSLLSLLAVMEE